MLIITIVASIGLGIFISKLISKPINDLAAAADKLAVGDVDVLLKTDTHDEVGDLAKSMTAMVKNIHDNVEAATKLR